MYSQTRGCILVVEDHADTLRFLIRLLSMSGFAAFGAGSVAEALQVAKRERCRLLLTDIRLPDGSGIDLFRDLRSESDVKGIALTGDAGDGIADATRAAGFAAHLTKPVTFEKLLETLKVADI
jgi:CheY-like chemotaxis protein